MGGVLLRGSLLCVLLLANVLARIEKGIFCEKCDLLTMRYCYEQRCDRSHFCFKTETASGCSNPYMHKIRECRKMHRGDCCFARQDLHGKRFNTSACAHEIPEVMCHSCTRLGGCDPISCNTGNLCYANRFESGCANTSSYVECVSDHGRCCEGRTALKAWNATQCQAEPAPLCETCPLQPSVLPPRKLTNCNSSKCPGLCFVKQINRTIEKASGGNVTTEYVETGCSPEELDVSVCNQTHQHCCTSYNKTECYFNYVPRHVSIAMRFFISFFVIFAIMTFILCLCFSDADES